MSEVRAQIGPAKPGSAALPLLLKKERSLVLHPGPCSAVQLPWPSKHLPLLKILQTVHSVAGAVGKQTRRLSPGWNEWRPRWPRDKG